MIGGVIILTMGRIANNLNKGDLASEICDLKSAQQLEQVMGRGRRYWGIDHIRILSIGLELL